MLKRLLIGVLAIILAVGGYFLIQRLEGKPPVILLDKPLQYMGAKTTVSGTVTDGESGVSRVRVLVYKPGRSEKVVLDESLPAKGFLRSGTETEMAFSITLEPKELGLADGEAVLVVTATDYSLRRWGAGNLACQEFPVTVDTRAPSVSVLSRLHYFTQGGAGLVIYRINEKVQKSGVLVGERFYPGYAGHFSDPDVCMAFLAIAHDQDPDTPVGVTATDLAGNQGGAGFFYRIRKKRFPEDRIAVTDAFIRRVLPQFPEIEAEPGMALVDKFLRVNKNLRRADTEAARQAGGEPLPKLLWKGGFLRLPASAEKAGFADHRNYVYKGKVVDRQFHLGIDLASTANSPVPAANSGRVAYTGDLGIYGQTVIVDHGFGLYTMYSHLSRIDCQAGDNLKKGQKLGLTGSTGLAAGDHLHFAVLVHDTFVNPLEWWDASWIRNNITSKIAEVEESLSR
ncbi:MAG: M23 family metallopeptidase [Deltaproteobacteria bacterium]|nr:M23 family metallopeptidase [Deltaproteobacteria bacterium]